MAFCEVQSFFVSLLLRCFNSFVSASYISVNIKADVTLNATQAVTVSCTFVQNVSSSLCTEELVLIDVVMLREMSVGWSHTKKRIVILYSVIMIYYIYLLKINGQLFVLY